MKRPMTGLDTNILVRFIMADDRVQAAKARKLIQSFSPQSPGFITLVCLVELVWILRSKYRQPKSEITRWLDGFLTVPDFVIEGHEAVTLALKAYQAGNSGFADCLIERCGHFAGCRHTITFDRKASKYAGMKLL
jgi:predicted nucleic-acid-binding protein